MNTSVEQYVLHVCRQTDRQIVEKRREGRRSIFAMNFFLLCRIPFSIVDMVLPCYILKKNTKWRDIVSDLSCYRLYEDRERIDALEW